MKAIRGVVPILVTPFDDHGHVDVESLERLVDYVAATGVHGLGIGLGSEIVKLSEAERSLVVRTVVRRAANHLPVIVHIGAPGSELAVHYGHDAVANGADVVMAPLPAGQFSVGPDGAKEFYTKLSAALEVPVMIQDYLMAPMTPQLIRDVVDGSFRPWYCKIETQPTPTRIANTIRETDGMVNVLGGLSGEYFLEELRQGSTGTMPGCSVPGSFVEVWNLYVNGALDEARDVFYRQILPVNRLTAGGADRFFHVHKRILHRLGVISHAVVRGPTPPIDDITAYDVDRLTEGLTSRPLA